MRTTTHHTLDRIVKCAVSLVVFLGDAAGELLTRLAGKIRAGRCVVVYYHSVPTEEQEQFARQLNHLQRRATIVSLNHPVDLSQGTLSVALTFDDAFENFVTCALPELQKRKIPATLFVITEALNKAFGPPDSFEKVMSAEQLMALPADLVTVGSHTETHPMLPEVFEDDGRREIAGSKRKLEALLGRRVELFSFPFGGFNYRLVRLCREAGYQRVFSTLPYLAFRERKEFVVGRVRVDPTDWPLEFHLKLVGAYRWLPFAIELKRKVLAIVKKLRNAGAVELTPRSEAAKSAIRELSVRRVSE